jgi:hypothetical protein
VVEKDVQAMESYEARDCNMVRDKQLEFAQKDNKGTKYTLCQYLQRYVFIDLHEAYFCFFP